MTPKWHCTLLTLFPEMFPGPLAHSIAGKAYEKGIWSYNALNIRNFAEDTHQTVDDTPYGGGAGMVMKPDVLGKAIKSLQNEGEACPLFYLSPRGQKIDQKLINSLANYPKIALLCGRYEGIDERVIEAYNIQEISLGDFILSGGEIAALALMDSCIRLLPGVMGSNASGEEESFSEGLLEYPLYTKPRVWEGREVPEVLLSGNHQEIRGWRRRQSEIITKDRRPDLWSCYEKRDSKNEHD